MAIGEEGGRTIVSLRDPLANGPLLPVTSLDDWAGSRQRFWAEVVPEDSISLDGFFPDPRLLRTARTLTLWLGNGLGDQITLPWFCWLLDSLSVSCERLRIVQFPPDFSARHRTPFVDALTPEQLRSHPPAESLTPTLLDHLRDGWTALTSPQPIALSKFLTQLDSFSPIRQLAFLSLRYPNSQTGLSFWDRALLANVAKRGPNAAGAIAYTISGKGWDMDPIGDGWLFWRLLRLSASRVPLVRVTGNVTAIRGTTVELTTAGLSVLDGTTNALDLNPVDDWIGGVRLDSAAGGAWVTAAGPNDLDELPNNGLQLTWRSLPLTPRS